MEVDVEVTSVSKRQQPQRESAAAIYVLSGEDIRRSGATTVMDALRLVPGVEVARVTSHDWAITVRGFNFQFSQKLLVLIDGRTVYTPTFAGVYWDVQDLNLADIDRIEVIRGPGGTLWGANAVNGVINIITKNAEETQGGLLNAGGGTEEQGFGSLRYGGTLGEEGFYRVYAKFVNRDDGVLDDGGDALDAWRQGRAGFRLDWNLDPESRITLQGDYYRGIDEQLSTIAAPVFPFARMRHRDVRVEGGNLLTRWTRQFTDDSELQIQSYFSYASREQDFDAVRNTLDLEITYSFLAAERHNVVFGGGYRLNFDNFDNSFQTNFEPDSRSLQVANVFIQDQISFMDDALRLTLGTKVEYNDYTDVEIQPNLRVTWLPNDRHMVWGGVSRAVRTPSRSERDFVFTVLTSPGLRVLFEADSPSYKSEDLLAYELGYRYTPNGGFSADLALFYHDYEHLQSGTLGVPRPRLRPFPHLEIPILLNNDSDGHAYGFEVTADWAVKEWWRLQASYSFLEINLRAPVLDFTSEGIADRSPEQQFVLRSLLNLADNVSLDVTAKFVDRLPDFGIEDYTDVDVRLGWSPRENIELAIVGQNLLDSSRKEFDTLITDFGTSRNERGVYGEMTWEF